MATAEESSSSSETEQLLVLADDRLRELAALREECTLGCRSSISNVRCLHLCGSLALVAAWEEAVRALQRAAFGCPRQMTLKTDLGDCCSDAQETAMEAQLMRKAGDLIQALRFMQLRERRREHRLDWAATRTIIMMRFREALMRQVLRRRVSQ